MLRCTPLPAACLDDAYKQDTIDGYDCAACKRKHKAVMTSGFITLPDILFIQIVSHSLCGC